MFQFFRRIRQGNLGKQQYIKYLFYALGEILLVVVGILIAVAIDNWNEQRKLDEQRELYRQSLIGELEEDLDNLNRLKSFLAQKKASIQNYVEYYNRPSPVPGVLIQKSDSINSSKSAFYTGTYTIEDLITTGNLTLFPKEEKEAILTLKNLHQRYFYYESQTIENIALFDLELKKHTDLLNLYKYSEKQHPSVADWQFDITTIQYRIFNNTHAESLKLYDFQDELYDNLIWETEALLDFLNAKKR